MTTRSIAFRPGKTRNRGSNTIGADHQSGRQLPLLITAIFEADSADASVLRADQTDEVRFERDFGAGVPRGVDQQLVYDSPARCVQPIQVVLRFDLNRDDLVTVVKRRRTDDRSACFLDSVENAPSGQLEDAGPHEGMGRDRIAAVAAAVDGEHANAAAREKQRRGRAGATGSDDDDVVIEG
jgi:uncharacterized protein YcfJ